MSLMDAPAYDPSRDNRNRTILAVSAAGIAVLILLTLAGYVLGHGWLFSNLGYEHRVDGFYKALEQKDYGKAYDIYNGGTGRPNPDYPLDRFTEDWTTHSPVNGPVVNHHVDISRTDGSGNFGTGVIVAAHLNGEHKVFMYVNRADKSMTWPAPHELGY